MRTTHRGWRKAVAALSVSVLGAAGLVAVAAPATATPETEVAWSQDFSDGTFAPFTIDSGTAQVVEFEGRNVLRVNPTADWGGLETPNLTADVTYTFTAQMRLAEPGPSVNARLWGMPGNTYTNGWPGQPLSADEWTTVTGEWTGTRFRLVSQSSTPFLLSDVVVTRPAGAEPFVPHVVQTWTFATEADMADVEAAGPVALSRVEDPTAEDGWVLLAANRSADWHAPRLHVPTTELAEYRLDVTMRVVTGATGQLQARIMPGFTYMGNQNITNVFTTVSTQTFVAGGPEIIAIHAMPANADFMIDTIELWRVAPAPDIDPGFEFERLEWDFEDGTAQGWFPRFTRNTPAGATRLDVTTPGFESNHAIAIVNRLDQGDGPMFDIAEYVRPGLRLEFTADIRFLAEPTVDPRITLSIQNGPNSFTNLVQNMTPGTEWTQVRGEFVVPAFTTHALIYFETAWAGGAAGETAPFEIDNIVIDRPQPLDWDRNLVPLWETLPGMNVGVAVDSRDFTDEFGEVIAHHFTHLVGENHHKPDSWFTSTAATTPWSTGIAQLRMHNEGRAILDFALENDMTAFGHVLVWHAQIPSWFFTPDSNSGVEFAPTAANQQIMIDRLWEYIGGVAAEIYDLYGPFGSAGNPFNSYEVANEVVHGGGPAAAATHNLRPGSPWTRIFAPDPESYWVADRGFNNRDWFLYEAFQAADYYMNYRFHVRDARGRDNADPDRITLWINDYNTERGLISPDNPATKRFQLLQVTNRLLEAGAPLDGVGHQFHAGLIHPVEGLRHALDLFAYENGFVAKPVLQAITEIDVTIPAATEANFLAQGHYYREAFDIIRSHHLEHGDIDTVTMWGLNDGRSWRATQFPLLFADDLTAKWAFAGAVYNAQWLVPDIWERFDRPELPTTINRANVFGQSIPMDDAVFTHPAWDALPSHRLTGPAGADAGSFEVRWAEDVLYVLLTVPFGEQTAAVGGGRNLGTRAVVNFEDTSVTVWYDGLRGAVVDAEVITIDDGDAFRAVVRFPLTGVLQGDVRSLDVFTFNGPDTPYIGGIQASNSERGAWTTRGGRGELLFKWDLGFVQIPQADVAPVLGAFDAAVWAGAQVITTDLGAQGVADAATAEARLLWYQGTDFATLFALIDVDDSTPCVASANAHEQDSVEIFLGLADRAFDGAPDSLMDAQFRVSRAGAHSFGMGLGWAMPLRIASVVEDNGTDGYRVMVAIQMRTGTGHQVGQWESHGGLGTVHGFDLQVNDARNGSRAAVRSWANPTDQGWASTTNWGVMQLVDALEVTPSGPRFIDVPEGAPFFNEIEWLAERGVTQGYYLGDGVREFRPGNQVHRGALAAFFYRLAGTSVTGDFVTPTTARFVDVPLGAPFFREIEWFASVGISTGYADGTFRPANNAHRGAISAFMYRFADLVDDTTGFVTPTTARFVDVPVGAPFFRQIEWMAANGISTGYADGTFRSGNNVHRGALAAFMYRLAADL